MGRSARSRRWCGRSCTCAPFSAKAGSRCPRGLLAPVLCFVFLVTTGPPFAEQFREHGESAVHVLDWPCAIGERQHIFRKVAFAPRANYTERLVIEAFRELQPTAGISGFRMPAGPVEYASSAANYSEAFDLIIVSREFDQPLQRTVYSKEFSFFAEAAGPPPRQRWRTRSFHDGHDAAHAAEAATTPRCPSALGLVWLLLNYVAHAVRDKRLRLREFRRSSARRPACTGSSSCCADWARCWPPAALLQLVVTSVPDRFGVLVPPLRRPHSPMVVLYAYALHVISYMTLVSVFFTSETLAVLGRQLRHPAILPAAHLLRPLVLPGATHFLPASQHGPPDGNGRHPDLRTRP
ncbi:hypothetical protein HPB48_026100 [Haemaphysalis longicornis]|uniref:Uncharacterized protein n=1 Tax=Haemaphysalis longicornis TaxID=44386 RepID=A0A9J6HAZ3_HAELO|nr:hypothetical protein HPB48_026100 [Haemaphysalis longicornis]